MYIMKKLYANLSMDGSDICREYFRTTKIWFGSSELQPGQTGGIDPGHPYSHEIFYAAKGHVIVRNSTNHKCYELLEGDALLIEEGEAHEITNIGTVPALVIWSGSPVIPPDKSEE